MKVFLAVAVILFEAQPVLASDTGSLIHGLDWPFHPVVRGIIILLACALVFILYPGMSRRSKARNAEKRTRAAIDQLALTNPGLDWNLIEARIEECVEHAFRAASTGESEGHSQWVTDHFWSSGSAVALEMVSAERSQRERSAIYVAAIRPLSFLAPSNDSEPAGALLTVAISIESAGESSAARASTPICSEHLWSFELTEGEWKVWCVELAYDAPDFAAELGGMERPTTETGLPRS